MLATNHALIAKVTVQSLLQQMQHAEVLLTFGDVIDAHLPGVLKETFVKMRQQLNDLEYRLGII